MLNECEGLLRSLLAQTGLSREAFLLPENGDTAPDLNMASHYPDIAGDLLTLHKISHLPSLIHSSLIVTGSSSLYAAATYQKHFALFAQYIPSHASHVPLYYIHCPFITHQIVL